MYPYTITQWTLFFFVYCFAGWIWECCYVSVVNAVKTKKFRLVNRGFLNGPFLPIYGCAAMVILIAAIPVQKYPYLVFLFGMIAATLMELVTGTVMEHLFQVKYWDYSHLPLNYKGYICLIPSVFWGFCSLFMIYLLHVPVERVVLSLPRWFSEAAATILVAVFCCDFTTSFREAMDMRELLKKISEYNETLQRLERRLDAYAAFAPAFEGETKHGLLNSKGGFLHNVEQKRKNRLHYLRQLRSKIESFDRESLPDKEAILENIETQLKNLLARTNSQFLKARRRLRRNPGVISKKYQDALGEIRELLEKED